MWQSQDLSLSPRAPVPYSGWHSPGSLEQRPVSSPNPSVDKDVTTKMFTSYDGKSETAQMWRGVTDISQLCGPSFSGQRLPAHAPWARQEQTQSTSRQSCTGSVGVGGAF